MRYLCENKRRNNEMSRECRRRLQKWNNDFEIGLIFALICSTEPHEYLNSVRIEIAGSWNSTKESWRTIGFISLLAMHVQWRALY